MKISLRGKQNFFHMVIITVSSVWELTFFYLKLLQKIYILYIHTLYIYVNKYGDATKIYMHTRVYTYVYACVYIYLLQVLPIFVPF